MSLGEIITNNIPRLTLYWHDLSAKEQEQFDWMDEDQRCGADFVRYRGWVYSVGDFTRWNVDGWDGAQNDTYFSGVCIRLDPEYTERVVMGTYYS